LSQVFVGNFFHKTFWYSFLIFTPLLKYTSLSAGDQ
jgi:hypothetical protein